jgi:uncharacterized protein involved in response to NO
MNMMVFSLGFRCFFLGAGLFAVFSKSIWSLLYLVQMPFAFESISATQWHAHEMIYGYSLAVIAGFLLTAVRNWTGVQTISGKPLIALFSIWLLARLLFLFGTSNMLVVAIVDILFSLLLFVAVSYPVVKVKQWKQIAVLSKIFLLVACNICFYLGAAGELATGINIGLYGGLYLVIGLILTIGRRVIPFFIEVGVGYPVKLHNARWLDISSLVLFLGFFISELFLNNSLLSAWLALGVFAVNAMRLVGWHTHGIWQKTLLWSLYLSFWFICFGFLLFAGVHYFGVSKYLAIHAFAYGGIGVVTLSMMSRVSLGHTGREVNQHSVLIRYALLMMLAGAVIRVVLPLFNIIDYSVVIGLSQLLWILSFLLFVGVNWPILTRPNV